MNKILRPACIWCVLVFAAGAAEARAQAAFGVQGNYGTDADVGLGARILYNIEDVPLEATGALDFYFPGDDPLDSWFDINANLVYPIRLEQSSIQPYVAGGLNLAILSFDIPETPGLDEDVDDSDTELGVNLGGGLRFPTRTDFTPFVEARAVLGGVEQGVFTVGVLFWDLNLEGDEVDDEF